MPLGPTARRILGLPDAGEWEQKKARAKQKKTNKGGGPEDSASAPANPWETAAAQLRAEQTALPAGSAAVPLRPAEPAAPWAPVDEHSGSAFARRFGRGVLWALVAVLALAGIKSIVVQKKDPPPAAAPTTTKAEPVYPVAEAQAIAARFARAYFTWDEADPSVRVAALRSVLPDGMDTALGWSGKGKQEVIAVEPGAVTPTGQQARVRVDVLIRSAAGPAAAPPPAGAPAPGSPSGVQWIGLDVPVTQSGGQVIVTGQPGLIGVAPKGPKLPEGKAPETDGSFSTATADTVARFFKAYAGGGDTESVTAPGAIIPPLPAGVVLVGTPTWTADKGSGSDRSGTARVSWQIGGAQLEQTYWLKLTRVASADAERWQVASVSGGTL